jgi:hypothetical protein
MKTTIFAAAALVAAIASPAAAQSFGAPIVPGNADMAAYASSHGARIGGDRAYRNRTTRRAAPFQAYGQVPRAPSFEPGYRWPGARYDANGYYIDPNSPGRW